MACVAGCGQPEETSDATTVGTTNSTAIESPDSAAAATTQSTAKHDPPEELRLVDLSGTTCDPLQEGGANATVFLFTRYDCPISNRYAPEVCRLHGQFNKRGVKFFLVYPDPKQTLEGVQRHMEEYGYECGALLDPHHDLVGLTGATITPEAAVFDAAGQLAYLGRINDRYVDFGKARPQATQHDLQDALRAVLDGTAVPNPRTQSVGCFIADLK